MATQTVTVAKLSSLVLHLSIPVSEARWSSREAGPDRDDFGSDVACADDWSTRGNLTDSDSECSQGPKSTPCGHNSSRHNTSGAKAFRDSTAAVYESDHISAAFFRRMAPVPRTARRRLLLAVEPCRMAPRRSWVDGAKDDDEDTGSNPPDDVVADFCIPFGWDLLRKLRACKPTLQTIADRTRCVMYIRKTLLLRGTRRTKTWAKYLMCRFYCVRQPLLDRCFHMLEKFDEAFCTRYPCQHERPRVTLLPNRTVPENTALHLTRQRLRRSDEYFGQMPLLSDPHLINLAARLTTSCINESSLLAQLVAVEP